MTAKHRVMNALFITDNVSAMEMLSPIISNLPATWKSTFVYFGENNTRYNLFQGTDCLALNKFNAKAVREILNTFTPDILVFAREETTPVEPLFLEAAAQRGMPTLLVPHGLMVQNSAAVWQSGHLYLLVKQALRKLRRGRITPLGLLRLGIFRLCNDFKNKESLSRFNRFSKIAACGETMRDILISGGVDADNVVVTGSPKTDSYTQAIKNSKSLVGRTDIRILLLTNYFVEFGLWSPKQRSMFIQDIYYAVYDTLSVPLSIRIHPVNENRQDYMRIRSRHNLRFELCVGSLSDNIRDCDIAITTSSSSGLEAMAAGKPLIIHNPYNNVTVYDKHSGTYQSSGLYDLSSILKRIVHSGIDDNQLEAMNTFVRQQAHILDGMASTRIADLMIDMVKERKI